ncbi:MAG: response regulator transcription factor [Candidatus Dadabacteria bacterium]|nr:MAG: response regulator transcription factor [Candidatus Dadabacteria bacterium]
MAQGKVVSKKRAEVVKTIVACRYPLVQEGLSKILEEDKAIKVVSGVSNLIDLIESCKQFDFDILLLGIELKGLNLTKILGLVKKNKNAKVILLIDRDYSENLLINAIRSGVRGYVLKDVDSSHLIKSVKAVFDGELWVERKLMGKVVDGYSYPTKKLEVKGQIYDLTETEIKIIKLVLTGMTNREVADELYISEKTVKFHLYKIFKKLTVKNRAGLILFGFRNGFVT